MKEPNDLTEWNLAGLTTEQGQAKWASIFAGAQGGSRLTVFTQWGWLAWEAADVETAHLARIASRIPPPVLVEIAVRDPDSGSVKSFPTTNSVTVTAWSALAGLVGGGVAGCWWWGPQLPALLLAAGVAAGSAAIAMFSALRISAENNRHFRVLCESDVQVAEVLAGSKILTWVTDQLRMHQIPVEERPRGDVLAEPVPELLDAVHQLHRALWVLSVGRGDGQALLAEMNSCARLVGRLIDTWERVREESIVRVAPAVPPPRGEGPGVERLREEARRLEDVIDGHRQAADEINNINRRFDETG